VRFSAQENGVSSGRSPDGSIGIRRLDAVTPGTANASLRPSAIVINEIMYDPISGNTDDEYLELKNTSSQSINVSGWRINDGIDFVFPTNTEIPPGGYLAVAQNMERLLANYSQLNSNNTVGNFDGSLSNGGERIALAKPDEILRTNEFGEVHSDLIYIVVNEVTYRGGGRWGQWSHGGGSSLELIDHRSDTTLSDNWADSDETSKGTWTTVSFTGVLDHGASSYPPNQLQITLQGVPHWRS
jgi:hypothetical protein